MYLSADGDSAMKKLGESVMSGYPRCTAHLLHLIAKALEKPYEETLENLDDVDLETVETIGTVISCARKICNTIRDKRSSFPVEKAVYRAVQTIKALIEVYDILKKLLDKYEKSSTLICEVISDFLALQDTFENMMDNQS